MRRHTTVWRWKWWRSRGKYIINDYMINTKKNWVAKKAITEIKSIAMWFLRDDLTNYICFCFHFHFVFFFVQCQSKTRTPETTQNKASADGRVQLISSNNVQTNANVSLLLLEIFQEFFAGSNWICFFVVFRLELGIIVKIRWPLLNGQIWISQIWPLSINTPMVISWKNQSQNAFKLYRRFVSNFIHQIRAKLCTIEMEVCKSLIRHNKLHDFNQMCHDFLEHQKIITLGMVCPIN